MAGTIGKLLGRVTLIFLILMGVIMAALFWPSPKETKCTWLPEKAIGREVEVLYCYVSP